MFRYRVLSLVFFAIVSAAAMANADDDDDDRRRRFRGPLGGIVYVDDDWRDRARDRDKLLREQEKRERERLREWEKDVRERQRDWEKHQRELAKRQRKYQERLRDRYEDWYDDWEDTERRATRRSYGFRGLPYSNDNYPLPPATQPYRQYYSGPQFYGQYEEIPPPVYNYSAPYAAPHSYYDDNYWRWEDDEDD